MKLKDLLQVLRSDAEIFDYKTMEKIGEFIVVYWKILDEKECIMRNLEELSEKEVVFVNNRFKDTIRIGIK